MKIVHEVWVGNIMNPVFGVQIPSQQVALEA